MKMLVLSMGAPDSTCILNMCIKKKSERCETAAPEVSKILAEEVYADDVLAGAESTDKDIPLIKDIDRILKEHGFNCHKFFSDDEETFNSIPEEIRRKNGGTSILLKTDLEEKVSPNANITIHQAPEVKCLGISINKGADSISYFTHHHLSKLIPTTQTLTRRIISQTVSSIYDPLGNCSFFTIIEKQVRSLTYKLEPKNIKKKDFWDIDIRKLSPKEESEKKVHIKLLKNWDFFLNQLRHIHKYFVPRYIYANERIAQDATVSQDTLCTFFDASSFAAGTIVYIRTILSNNQIISSFVTSKNRVLNDDRLTTPRKELILFRDSCTLTKEVAESFSISPEHCFFFGDSKIVISQYRYSYYKDVNNLKIFVSNQCKKLLQFIHHPQNVYYINTKSNVADILSRGGTISSVIENDDYLKGSDWIRKPIESFPFQDYQEMGKLKGDAIELKVHKHAASKEKIILVNAIISTNTASKAMSSDRDIMKENEALAEIFQIKRSLWKAIYVSF